MVLLMSRMEKNPLNGPVRGKKVGGRWNISAVEVNWNWVRRWSMNNKFFVCSLALLIIALLIPVVSAETVYDQTYEEVEISYVTTEAAAGHDALKIDSITISPSLAVPQFKLMYVVIPGETISNYNSLPDSANTRVDLELGDVSGSPVYGTGEYGYFKYTAGDKTYLRLWVELDPGADYSLISGDTRLYLAHQNEEDMPYPIVGGARCTPEMSYLMNVIISTDTPGVKGFFAGRTSLYQGGIGGGLKNHIFMQGEWKNRVLVNTVGGPDSSITDRSEITIYRSIQGIPNPSDVYISFADGSYPDIAGTSDIHYTVPSDYYPFSIDIKSPYDNWHNTTLFASAGASGRATIYIRDAQTGALIPDARGVITDATTDPLVEVVNATLPTGTGSFNLEKAPTLRYHASATAEGYTLLSPIQFGVGDDGTTIILWMSPNAAPDDPIEEGKSMLYGYIQTQGSQQPISGATVSLDGYSSRTTSSTGFYLFNNVTPGSYSISASAPLHDALSEPVTVDPAATPYNLALRGHFLLTVTAKDDTSLTNLHNATISRSDGQESTQNPATFTAAYGPYTITAAAGGYYPQTQSAYLDKPGTTTATVLLTAKPEPTPAPEYPNYPQHNVRFLCVDEYNHPLQNVTITAVYQESSGPVSWITDWLGLSQNVHVANSTLQGTTGLDGSVIFLMVQSVQYRMTVAAPAPLNMTKTFDLYPKEDQITIRFVTSPGPDLSTMPAYDLTATEINASAVRLALTYNDTTNATTSLTFNVYDHATGDVINTQTFGASSFPGTVSPTYTVENTKGAMYRFGFEATNTAHGPISQYTGITLKGDNLLVDLGFEDRTLYQWLAVILLFLFAGAFSGTTVKQGAILVPAFGGGLFWFIGWLPASLGGVISAIGFLGVLVYMRKNEWKVRA